MYYATVLVRLQIFSYVHLVFIYLLFIIMCIFMYITEG